MAQRTCGLEAEAANGQVRARRRRLLRLHSRHHLPQHAQQAPPAVRAARRGC